MSAFISLCIVIASLLIALFFGKVSSWLSNREVVELLVGTIMFLLIMCVFRAILIGKVITDNPFFNMKNAIIGQGLIVCIIYIWLYFFSKVATNYMAGSDI